MNNIIVGRYNSPGEDVKGFKGWIEPKDKEWIMFIRDNGNPLVFLSRDKETGAVLD